MIKGSFYLAMAGLLAVALSALAYDPKNLAGRWLFQDMAGRTAELVINSDGSFKKQVPSNPGMLIQGDMEAGGGKRIKINMYATEKGKGTFKICQVLVTIIQQKDSNVFNFRQIDPQKETPACNWNINVTSRLPSGPEGVR